MSDTSTSNDQKTFDESTILSHRIALTALRRLDATKETFEHLDKVFLEVFWKMSSQCNYRCSYCYLTEEELSAKFDSRDHYFRIAANIVKFIETRNVDLPVCIHFVGGEPTLNPYFDEIIEYFAEHLRGREVDISLTTNFSAPLHRIEKWIDVLAASNMRIKINASFHEGISADKFLLKAAAVRLKGVKLVIPLVFNPSTADTYLAFMKRAAFLNQRVSVKFDLREDGDYSLPKEQRREIMKYHHTDISGASTRITDHVLNGGSHLPTIRITAVIWRNGVRINKAYYGSDRMVNLLQVDNFKGWTCFAGSDSIHVNPDGTVKLGNGCGIRHDGNMSDENFDFSSLPNFDNPVTCPFDRCSSTCSLSSVRFKTRPENPKNAFIQYIKNIGAEERVTYGDLSK